MDGAFDGILLLGFATIGIVFTAFMILCLAVGKLATALDMLADETDAKLEALKAQMQADFKAVYEAFQKQEESAILLNGGSDMSMYFRNLGRRASYWLDGLRIDYPWLDYTLSWFTSLIFHRHNVRVIQDFEHRMSILLCQCTRGMSKPYYSAEDMCSEAQSYLYEYADEVHAAEMRMYTEARPAAEWFPGHGAVLWWSLSPDQAPWYGERDTYGRPASHNHWTPCIIPDAFLSEVKA